MEGDQQREGHEQLNLPMGSVRTVLAPTSAPEGREPAVISERPEVTEVVPDLAMKPQSYVKMAVKQPVMY